jgi:tRNA uridine 5-carboxymethylaminomethyl modification enzyme
VKNHFDVIVVGGGHAGIEAAWTAANRLGERGRVALISIDADKIGVMSCNPAIGGLAKGQLVREIDAMGGLMGLIADATGIQFKVLNTSKGSAVHGPRCQSDKHAYARVAQELIRSRPEIEIIEAMVEEIITEPSIEDSDSEDTTIPRVCGVRVLPSGKSSTNAQAETYELHSDSVIVTTGTFMRGLMHMGEEKTVGGRFGEDAATGISKSLAEHGFELGRLRTGTPPRLAIDTVEWDSLVVEEGDEHPMAFSELTPGGWSLGSVDCHQFPLLEQVSCRQSSTTHDSHELIRANLDRAPMYSGNMASGPRYCPSIEDKVVRFAERESHGVYLEPESHESDWIYCNGIATSLPSDIQDEIVKRMPGCEHAKILQYGYAVEYDMVRPHQILTTGQTRRVDGLFLAGQINGTSGYEEAAAQGLVAGLNAAMLAQQGPDEYSGYSFGREQAYIGVLMDDLVTKTPREPYRMFTSRAEHRLILRADNAPDRLTPIAMEMGLLESSELGRTRWELFKDRKAILERGRERMNQIKDGEKTIAQRVLEPDYTMDHLRSAVEPDIGEQDVSIWRTLHSDKRYEPYVERQLGQIQRSADLEHRPLPDWLGYKGMESLRTEARNSLDKYRPTTFGQASRLEGITPADITLLSVLVKRAREAKRLESID